MKKLFTFSGFLLFFLLIGYSNSFGQLNGTYTIPGSYATISAAITALNTSGVSGPVIFNVAAGYTETAVNLVLTNTTPTAVNTVTFQKSGAGANPLITAGVGAGTADGIIEFQGTDYVTFNGIDLQENAANITTTTQMEWGYGIFMAAGTNASQYITIQNCTITLNKTNTASNGIMVRNTNASTATTIIPTSTAGALSYNKFYSNTISNVYTGIYLYGYTTTTYYGMNNEIGNTAGTGNTISNYGGGATTAYGIYAIYQNGLRESYNTITSGTGTTTTLYGIFNSIGTSANVTISNNTVTIYGGSTTSTIYAINNAMGSTAASNTVNITNNTIQNCTYTTATSGVMYLLYNTATAANVNITGNTITNNVLPGTGSMYLLYNSASMGTNPLNISANNIYGNSKTGAGGTMYCMYASTASISCYSNNVYSNSITGGTGSLYGYYNGSTPVTESYYNNNIYNLTHGSTGYVYGIYILTASGTKNVYGNNIYGLSSAGGVVYGYSSGYGTPLNFYNNKIYNLTSTTASGIVYGVNLSPTTLNMYNNYISDLKTPAATGANAVNGIYIGGGTTANVFYNTVYLNASSTGTTFGSTGIYKSSVTTGDFRNNIIVNNSTPGTTSGFTVAHRWSGTYNSTYYSATSNNNCFYAGTPAVNRLIFYDGANSDQTIGDYKIRVASRDASSFTEVPPFTNILITPYDLHLVAGTPTKCESGGAPVTVPITVNTDYDGETRNATTPDVGADEGSFTPPPTMIYVSSTTTQLTGFATIGGINQSIIRIEVVTTGSASPISVSQFDVNANGTTDIADINGSTSKIYYTGTSGTFGTGTLFGTEVPSVTDYSIYGSQILSEGTNYFWLAYDVSALATSGNYIDGECISIVISGSPQSPSITAPAGEKRIVGPMAGNYYVGQGYSFPNFTTITDAFYNLGVRGVNGAVTLTLTNSAGVPYNTANGETFPLTLNTVTGASGTNTITMIPNTGVAPIIQGSSANAIIKLNGTDYFTIDGSNSGSTDRSLTIENTNAASATAGIWLSSGVAINTGATYNTIKNCVIRTGSQTLTTYGIILSGTTLGASSGYDHDYNTIQNNYIYRAYYGIYSYGVSTGTIDNLNITGNTVGAPVGTTTDYIYKYGIFTYYTTGMTMSQNTVQNIVNSSGTLYGIYLSTGTINSTIERNKVTNITYNGAAGYGGWGIYTNTGNAASNLTYSNNLICVIGGDGYTAMSNSSPVGIYFDGTVGGITLFYNSVYMSGNLTFNGLTLSAAIYLATTTITNIDMRNNIFQNSMVNTVNTTAKNYAIYSTAPATSYTQINFNDYYVSGTQGYLGYLGADQTTLAAWQLATGKDANSINVDPMFNSTTNLQPQIGSSVLAVGTPVSVTIDYIGITRSGTNPSIGAYEYGVDVATPSIVYTPFTNTTSTSDRVLSATISDISGVPTSGSYMPRIYYKKFTSGTWFSAAGVLTSGGSTNGGWDFTINNTDIGGVANGDSVFYFVIAQDQATPINIGSVPSGVVATDVNTISTYPTPYVYKIVLSPLSGTYTVGLSAFNKVSGKKIYNNKEENQTVTKQKNDDDKLLKNSSEKKDNTLINSTKSGQLFEDGKTYSGPNKIYLDDNNKKLLKGFVPNLTDDPRGVYTTITAAITDLNERGMDGAITFILVDGSYASETFPISINQTAGISSTNTITIQPADLIGQVVISGDNATALFDLNGADYVTLDGRPYGNTTPKQLLIRNTSSVNTATTMRFMNDACLNKIQYCVIEGAGSGVYPTGTNGTITFGTTTGTRGNDSNYVSNNDIRDRSDAAGTPNYAIYSYGSTGTVAQYNSDNFITDNNIFNFFNDGNIASACFLTTGTGDNWVFSGNSIYQTRELFTTSTTYTSWNVVFFGTTSINNINVSNNYIGGSAPNCGGNPWRVTNTVAPTAGSPTFIYVLRGSLGTTSASSFQNNTIANFRLNVYASLTASSTMFSGMIIAAGLVNVGTVSGNTIGNSSGNGNIEINFLGTNTFSPGVSGINHQASGSVNNNVVGSFTMSAPSTMTAGYSFIGISKSGTPIAAMTISNNTVGSPTVPNSIQHISDTSICTMTGISSTTATVGLTIDNNTVANLTNMSINTSTVNYVRGIIHTGTAIESITNNTVKNLYTLSGCTNATSTVTNAVIGIGSSSTAIGQNISGNIISGIRSATVIANNTYAVGIGVTSSSSTGTIGRNRIYDITNTSTGTAPYIIGLNAYYGTWTVPNNQITLTNGEVTDKVINGENKVNKNDLRTSKNTDVVKDAVVNNTFNNINAKYNVTAQVENKTTKFVKDDSGRNDGLVDAVAEETQNDNRSTSKKNENTELDRSTNGVVIYGIYDFTSTVGSYYYNSVYVGGSATSGTSNSFAFYRNGTPNIILRNNLFFNGRTNSGATGKHYAIGTSGSSAINPNYNCYVSADATTMGLWNATDQSFAAWKTSTAGDGFSYATISSVISATNLFSSITNGNLNINSGNGEAWLVSGKGTYLAGQTTDYEGVDSRSVTLAGGVTDIGSDEFSATPPNCPLAVESAAPSAGTTTTYTIYGRTLVSIDWGTGGSSYPAGMNVIYYSGIVPPGSTGNNTYSYCDVTPSSGTLTGATYDITTYFTDGETYTIVNPTTDTRLAKYTAGEWWVYGTAGTGNEQTELNWAAKWAKVRGLSSFSYFTFTDINSPLPVQLTSFTSLVSGRDVRLTWVTESEHNNAGFEIQRIKNSEFNSGSWAKVGFVKSVGNSNSPVTYTFDEKKLNSGKYNYRLKQIDNIGGIKYFALNNLIDIALPTEYKLSQNYPNPFNPVTKIDFELPFDSRVRIVVYDMVGREVKTLASGELKQAGFYTIELNAYNLSSGTYFYRMIANGQDKDHIFTKKMILVK